MTKHTIFAGVLSLILLSLIVSSCGSTANNTGKTTQPVTEKTVTPSSITPTSGMVQVSLEKLDGTSMTKMVQKPKYGGEVILGNTYGPTTAFDPFGMNSLLCGTVRWTNDNLLLGDWSKGPAGTNETSWQWGSGGRMQLMTDGLAESFQLTDPETVIFYIRHGVHWWNKAPVNGRELTADDVVWSINKAFTSTGSYFYSTYVVSGNGIKSCKALNKYTVEIKVPQEMRGTLLLDIGTAAMPIFPEGITEQVNLTDWKNCVGSGAWVLTDFVDNVVEEYSRNPTCWRVDPLFPENHLPYPDTLRILQIADSSTYISAFRTGKIDVAWPWVTWEDKEVLVNQKPELKYVRKLAGGPTILAGRIDKSNLPFKDIKVRQALNMAINKQEIIDTYYGGNAEMMGYLIPDLPEFSSYYIPLDQMPASVQGLFSYNPEKAKELLKEAGYADGFETVVQCSSSDVDFLAIIKNYLKDVNINLKIEPMETGAFWGVRFSLTQKEMIYDAAKNMNPFMLLDCRSEQMWDFSLWNDAHVNETVKEINNVFGQDDARVAQLVKEINPYIVEQAWGIWLPIPYVYFMYWPWVGGLQGEFDPGYNQQQREFIHVWIDKDLKKSMGH